MALFEHLVQPQQLIADSTTPDIPQLNLHNLQKLEDLTHMSTDSSFRRRFPIRGIHGPFNIVSQLCKAIAVIAVIFLTTAALNAQTINFESPTYSLGDINGQDGWIKTGGYDVVVANNGGIPGFGTQSMRISNAVTSGSFGDHAFSKPIANEAGETSAANGGISGGTRQNRFAAEWKFTSASPGAEQTGLSVVASPDRGDGARMSWIQMADTPTGLQVNFYDYQAVLGNTCGSGANFVFTTVASGLARNAVHTIRVEMDFVDGIRNDIVRVYVNGALLHTGTSWEDYFRDCESNPTRTVDSVLFRVSGTAAPATSGFGFFIDGLSMSSSSSHVVDDDLACPGATFTSITAAIAGASAGDTIQVCSGTYNEEVTVGTNNLKIIGAGSATTTVSGPIDGLVGGSTFRLNASNVELAGFTITRAGNNSTDWNNPNLASAGISIQGLTYTGNVIHDNVITGMRTAIDINASGGHTVRNNMIDFNHTGIIMRNQTDNLMVVENFITNNRTVGVLFLDASGGTNSPVQQAFNSNFANNNISGNWYGDIVDRQTGGSLPAPGTTNMKRFSGNWLGTSAPVVTTANSAEPAYTGHIPVAYGGTATNPGGQPNIAGAASANIFYSPLLTSGTDTNVETRAFRGVSGFQGGPIKIRPEAMSNWVFYNDENDTIDPTLGSFVNGPGTAPLGFGSAQVSVTGTQRRNLTTFVYAGTLLSELTTLKFSTYNPSAGNGGGASNSGFMVFNVDFNGSNTWQRRLVYVPSTNGTVQQDTWQEWDTIAGGSGKWGYSGATWPAGIGGGGEPGTTTKTWAQILAQYPAASMLLGDPHLGIRVGNPDPSGYTENIDSIRVGTGTVTTYDFEPTAIQNVDVDGFASATDCNDPTTVAHQTIGAAVAAANPGDTVRVCPGTYAPEANTIVLNKANLTLTGVGATKPVLQTSSLTTGTGTSNMFHVAANGITLNNLEIQKTNTANQDIIWVQGDNFTATNNLIYGPNPGGPWNVTGFVSRAFTMSPGADNVTVSGNVIHTLRQPAYLDAATGGTISNNQVSGTRGWVVVDGVYSFSGNTFGEPQNEACDIALTTATVVANHSPLLALSANNDNAYICSYTGGPVGRALAYVDATPSVGNGSDNDNYTTIQEGINGALSGGTVQVAEGTYVEQITIDKTLNVLGPNANINPNTGVRVAEAIIQPSTSNPIDPGFLGPSVVDITAPGVVFNGFTVDGDNPGLTSGVVYNGADVDAEFGITGGGGGSADAQATITNNIVKNIGELGVYLYDFGYNGAHTPSTFQYNKIDNVPGHGYGIGAIFSYNAYTNVLDNVVTRAGIGIVTENIYQPNSGAATSIANNSVTAHSYGIRVNTQSGYTSNGWTVTNNSVTSYIESYVRPTPVTRFNGIRLESLQGTIPLTVSNNTITPDRTALVGNGYTRVEGIYLTNTSTVTPNIVITQNTISNALRAISQTTPAVPTVTCNLLMNNDTGVYVGTDLGYGNVPSSSTNGININDNNIVGNTSFGVQNDSAFVTNAENNYWGSASGPGGAGPGTGDDVSANVDFSPFLAAPAPCAGIPPTVSISGTVSPTLAGVNITLGGDQVGATVTDGAGNYSFTGLAFGGNYLVTPSLAGYNFDPINRSYSNVTANVTNANFTRFTGGSPRLISVVSQNVVPGNQVVVPITMASQGNENAVGFSLSYDPAVLSNPVVALGTDSVGGSLIVNDGVAGQLGVIVAKPAGQSYSISPPARQLVTITFDTSATPPAFSTPLTFTDSPVLRAVADVNADPLPASYSSGAVTFATGFESDVAPRFNGSNTGSVNALDYSQTGRFAASIDAVNPLFNEFQRADAAPRSTKGNGSINAIDYSQAGRYAAGLDAVQSAGGPTVASLFSLEEAAKRSDDNLFGGVARTIYVENKSISSGTGTVTMSVKMVTEGNEGSMGFTLSYDQSILSNPIVSFGADTTGGVASMTVNTVTHPGRIAVVMDIPGNGVLPAGVRELVTVQFTVLVTPAVTLITPVGIPGPPPTDNIVGNFDDSAELPTVFTGGNLTILGPTAAAVTLGGQVFSSTGRDLGKVAITLTDTDGNVRTTLSNPFGFYSFEDVIVGRTYVIHAQAKGYTFQPQAVTINDQVTNLNLIADK